MTTMDLPGFDGFDGFEGFEGFDGFLHARDGRIVTGRGEPVLLRGVGLGNWLLPEGYMWRFESPGAQSPREIEALLADLVGPERAAEFARAFTERFLTRDDMLAIAAEGMNHVRLPLNARRLIDADGRLLPEGFTPIDRCIDWCREAGLWVVLDLHGAPGGQTGTNIDDSLVASRAVAAAIASDSAAVRATERVRMASGTPGSPGCRGQLQVNTVMVIVFIKAMQVGLDRGASGAARQAGLQRVSGHAGKAGRIAGPRHCQTGNENRRRE